VPNFEHWLIEWAWIPLFNWYWMIACMIFNANRGLFSLLFLFQDDTIWIFVIWDLNCFTETTTQERRSMHCDPRLWLSTLGAEAGMEAGVWRARSVGTQCADPCSIKSLSFPSRANCIERPFANTYPWCIWASRGPPMLHPPIAYWHRNGTNNANNNNN
jgi:hypothetical protein